MPGAQGTPSRASSTGSSAFSNITVGPRLAADGDASTLTPPTSVSDGQSTLSADQSTARPKRKRTVSSSYNLQALSASKSRNVSGMTGSTLVDGERRASAEVDKPLDKDWANASGSSPRHDPPARPERRVSVRDRLKNATHKVGSVLGKRSRDAIHAGKKKLGLAQPDPKHKKLLRELDTGKRGVLDEIDLDTDFSAPPSRPAKKVKVAAAPSAKELAAPLVSGPLQKTSSGRRVKKWQTQGLFVGQEAGDGSLHPAHPKKLQKKRPNTASSTDSAAIDAPAMDAESSGDIAPPTAPQRRFMPLPMFQRLEQSRDFVIPYDVFAPAATKADKPKDWRQLNRNRLVGEARDLWEKTETLPVSVCVCPKPFLGEQGCEEDCLNRVMQYECSEDNCHLRPEQCSNRAFAELARRVKKGGAYDIGVEVIKTGDRGHGVRASRSFLPGQIIMEYTGEIISEAECQRRMREDYKDAPNYYLMELERNLVIDGTKGSMARFINHSCEPNCEVRMVKVGGIPRMGVFAGTSGIMTGEELTYDYNFDNFGETKQTCYCGAPSCRGFLSKRLNAAEQKKQAKEELERKRKAAVDAQKRAEEDARRKKVKTDRGSSWRGWVSVDDAEVKQKLKEEKRLKEEAEKSSSRAQRAAARRTSLPGSVKPVAQRTSPRRAKTILVDNAAADQEAMPKIQLGASPSTKTKSTAGRPHARAPSIGGKFTEELYERPRSSKQKVVNKTTITSVTTTTVDPQDADAGSEGDEITLSNSVSITQTVSTPDVNARKEQHAPSTKTKRNSLLASVGNKLKQTTLSFTKLG